MILKETLREYFIILLTADVAGRLLVLTVVFLLTLIKSS